MAINSFEGARRIALLVGGGAAVITVLVAFNENGYYHAQYSLAAPNAPFRKTDGGCQFEGREIYFNHKTASGKDVSVSLCLEPMTFTMRGGSGWLDSLGPFLSGVWRIADYATLCRIVRWS